MNISLFIMALVTGFIAFVMVNKIWEDGGGEVNNKTVVIAAFVTVGIAYWVSTLG